MSRFLFIHQPSAAMKLTFTASLLSAWLINIWPTVRAVEAEEPARRIETAPTTAEAPLYDQGGTWIYRSVEKLTPGAAKSESLNGNFEISLRGGGRPQIVQLDNDKRLPVSQPRALRLLLPTERIIAAQTRHYDFPLSVGKKWRASYRQGKHSIDAEHSVGESQTLTTPAGSFQVFPIESISYFISGQNHRNEITETYFYSPQTQSVIRYHLVHLNKWGVETNLMSEIDIELIEVRRGAATLPQERPLSSTESRLKGGTKSEQKRLLK
jgi:hypothetical protein